MIEQILTGIIGAVGTAALIGFIHWVYKKYMRDKAFPTKIDNLETRMDRSDELHLLTIRSQRSQSKTLVTILEVVAQNKNNGNVDEAFKTMSESDLDIQNFMDRQALGIKEKAKGK